MDERAKQTVLARRLPKVQAPLQELASAGLSPLVHFAPPAQVTNEGRIHPRSCP
jgi:hypothetical protein